MLSTSKYILSKNTCIFDMYYLHIRRKRRRKDCARHVVSYRLQRYFHKEMFVWDCIYRGVVSGGAWGAMAAPPDFGRSVNPISTRGADYAHQMILAPPDFQTFLRP